jgi:glycosyltransferase involved in cell wall biosynthesis
MKIHGYCSETFTFPFYKNINNRSDWDRVLDEEYKIFPYRVRKYFAFIEALFMYDIFVISFRGFFLQNTAFRYLQAQILKLAGKKIVVIPYGSDAYVYRSIRSTSVAHSLMISYPQESKKQELISSDVSYWTKQADAIIPGLMAFDGIGRWEVLAPSSLVLDLGDWYQSKRKNTSDGYNSKIVIAHSPNHRGAKGTEFVVDAVESLKKEGFNIELKLLENVKNSDVKKILTEETDILVEQLIFNGHGMNGLEGMACGLPTITNLEYDSITLPMRRWSFLDECPLVSASPENIADVLRQLISNPQLRNEIGVASRKYVEKYHGLDSAHYLFTNIIDYIYDKKDSIINLYHPILGDYTNRSPKIKPPLKKNKIVCK